MTVLRLDVRKPENILFVFLNLMLLSVGVTTKLGGLPNANIVMRHELAFVVAFLLLLRPWRLLFALFEEFPAVAMLVGLWVISMSVSLLFSPYNMAETTVGMDRYFQTLTHFAFFISIFALFHACDLPIHWLFVTIVASVALACVYALAIWLFSTDEQVTTDDYWWWAFPTAGHARHMGYNALVATSIALVFVLFGSSETRARFINVVLLVVVMTLMFWLGGRGAVLSVAIATVGVVVLSK